LKIGINCLSIKPRFVGGVSTFTFGLINGLIALDNDNIYQIYVNKQNVHLFNRYYDKTNVEIILCKEYNVFKKIISNITLLVFPIWLYKLINNKLFSGLEELMDGRSDLIYTPTPTLINYTNRKPTLVSMHDIQHFHFPAYFSFIKLMHRKTNYLLTAEYSDYLQASSNFIKKDFLHHYPFLNSSKIIMINEGVIIDDFKITRSKAIENCKDYKLPEEFIFYPAQLWYHKDHITVLKAIRIIREKYTLKINLVLTGEKFSASKIIFKYINRYSLQDQVFYLGKIPFKDIVSIYSLSKYFITATLYESSSLPVLEAASSGTAIIASDTHPNKEMSQILDMNLFKTKNETSLSEVIMKVWNNRALRENQIKNNWNNINRYAWSNIAHNYNKIFIKMVKK